jgi:hypothetical protein
MLNAPRRFLMTCLASTALAAPAFAENPEIVDVLVGNFEQQTQLKPTFDSAEEDGDGNVIIKNMSFSPSLPEATMTLTIGEIRLNDVSEGDEGLYEIGSAVFKDMKLDGKSSDGQAFSASMPEGTAESWYIYDAGDSTEAEDLLRASMNVAKRMSTGPITISAMGQTVTSDGYVSTWDGDPETGAGKFDTKMSNIVIPESVLDMADPSGTLKGMGYSSITIDVSGTGETRMDEENIGMDLNVGIAAKDMAGLKLAFNAEGIPIAAYAELHKAQSSGKEPDFNALMPQLQNVSFGNLSIRLEDASITKKLLPMIAMMSGMGDETALVANAGAMAQVGLMQLNAPEFSAQTVAAINAFLKDPKSFTIAAKPASPVTVTQLMTINPADPGAAIKMLNVMVSAND